MTEHNLDATVFVFKHRVTGEIEAHYWDKAKHRTEHPDWLHVASIEPRYWIQAHYQKVMDWAARNNT